MVVGLERDEHDLAHDRGGRRQHRWLDIVRQRGDDRRQLLRHRLPGTINVLTPVEVDPDDGDPDGGGRTDPPHAGPTVERRLDRKGDERLHVGRRDPVSFHQHRHGRRGQIRKHVDRHLRRHVAAPDEERDGHREHDETVSQRPLNETVNHIYWGAAPDPGSRARGGPTPRAALARARMCAPSCGGAAPDPGSRARGGPTPRAALARARMCAPSCGGAAPDPGSRARGGPTPRAALARARMCAPSCGGAAPDPGSRARGGPTPRAALARARMCAPSCGGAAPDPGSRARGGPMPRSFFNRGYAPNPTRVLRGDPYAPRRTREPRTCAVS